MREHVSYGCELCGKRVLGWLLSAAETDSGHEGSREFWALRRVRALIDPEHALATSEDTGRDDVPFDAGNFIVDILLDFDLVADRVYLGGQVLHQRSPLGGADDLRVVFVEGNGQTSARTRTNELGEFVLAVDPSQRVRLALVINRKRAIVVPSTEPGSDP